MPLKLPNVDPKRKLARKVLDSSISSIPGIGNYCSLVFKEIIRDPLEEMQEKWRSDITNAVNDLEKIVDDILPKITLSKNAISLGYWISQASEDGCPDPLIFDSLQEAFPDAERIELEDACGELELVGLVTLSPAMDYKVRIIRPTYSLFEIFDPLVFEDSNPRMDAAHLARYILTQDEVVGAEEMIQHCGLSIRRFNPAIAIICSMIDEGRKRVEDHPTYYCRLVFADSKERAELRHFANLILGEGD